MKIKQWLRTANLDITWCRPVCKEKRLESDVFIYVTLAHYITVHLCYEWRRDSSVSIVSDYGVDDRAIGVRSPAGAKDFFPRLDRL
jgi:hypothetical protein